MNRQSSKTKRRQAVGYRNDAKSRLRLFVTLIFTAAIISAGLFMAARQHFSSIDLGIRNSRLRSQLDDLEKEKRRLIVARENSLSPLEIRRAAQKVGLFGQVQSEVAGSKSNPTEMAGAKVSSDNTITKTAVELAGNATVVKTAFTRPTAPEPRAQAVTRKIDAVTAKVAIPAERSRLVRGER